MTAVVFIISGTKVSTTWIGPIGLTSIVASIHRASFYLHRPIAKFCDIHDNIHRAGLSMDFFRKDFYLFVVLAILNALYRVTHFENGFPERFSNPSALISVKPFQPSRANNAAFPILCSGDKAFFCFTEIQEVLMSNWFFKQKNRYTKPFNFSNWVALTRRLKSKLFLADYRLYYLHFFGAVVSAELILKL